LAKTKTAPKVDEDSVRDLFARFNDRDAFFADPEGTWTDRPRYRVIAQDLELNSREEVVAWFRKTFDAVPDLKMEVEDVAIAGEAGHERVTVRWRMTGTFSGAPYLGIEPTGRSIDLRGMDLIDVEDGKVARITGGNQEVDEYELEPQLLTALFDTTNRAKRQIIKYPDIPKVMVDAVLAIEDRRFFQHSGVNYLRFMEAALIDLREGSHDQGASTLTMQMARAFFLTPEKTIKRKATEMLIAIELEQKLSKEQIFELYANQVDMGQRGSFTIVGFAEAARAYFNKDLQSVTLPEAALLAGIIQRPSYLSPYRHPERALNRRNLVLESMVDFGAITRAQCDQAKATPLKLAPMNVEASDAPYFVDLVKEQLSSRYPERELNEQAYRIYTTIDPELQRAAADAVQQGMKLVDEQVTKLRTRKIRSVRARTLRLRPRSCPAHRLR
jgi:penicillin-binding protein 1B